MLGDWKNIAVVSSKSGYDLTLEINLDEVVPDKSGTPMNNTISYHRDVRAFIQVSYALGDVIDKLCNVKRYLLGAPFDL